VVGRIVVTMRLLRVEPQEVKDDQESRSGAVGALGQRKTNKAGTERMYRYERQHGSQWPKGRLKKRARC